MRRSRTNVCAGAREGQRARTLEADLREARAEVAALTEKIEHAPSRLDAPDVRALADATATTATRGRGSSRRCRRGSRRAVPPVHRAVAGAVEAAPSAARAEKPLARRIRPPVPPGVVAASANGIEAMLRADDVLLVVDGYNVTKRAWPDATPAEQRDRLGVARRPAPPAARVRRAVVFDGDGRVPAGPASARRCARRVLRRRRGGRRGRGARGARRCRSGSRWWWRRPTPGSASTPRRPAPSSCRPRPCSTLRRAR